MTIFYGTLALIVLVAVICRSIFLQWRIAPRGSVAELATLSRPVDMQSFRNLVDPDEEAHLRSNLSRADFRRSQRARMIAAMEYVRRTAHNAALLLRLGETARQTSDPDIARAGSELANFALQLRFYSMLALCVFALRIAIPSLPMRPSNIISNYDRMRECMAGLARLQAPGIAAQVDAAL